MSSLQTLFRGLTALELVAQKENGLVTRGRDGRICLGGSFTQGPSA